MGGAGFGGMPDVGALARQYWQAMTDAMRSAGAPAAPADPWRAALDGWSRLAGGHARGDAGDLVERFSAQARQWFGAMQGVAEQFAGRNASAGDIAAAWKDALGGGQGFATLFDGLGGRGQTGFDGWYAQVAPMLSGMLSGMPPGMFQAMPFGAMLGGLRQDGLQWLRMPAFGPAREHQERWQALAAAMTALQQKNDDYTALLLEAGRDAFERFERKLEERSEPGRQLQSARALFDLWIDAAEEAYAEIALSPRFRRVYGDLVNAQMQVRAGVQGEVERMAALFGMPGRTEVDAAHRRIAELERQVRRMSAGRDAASPARRPAPAAAAADAEAPAPSASARPAARRARASQRAAAAPTATAGRAAAKKPASKRPAAKRAVSKQAAVDKAAANKAAANKAAKPAPKTRAATRAAAPAASKRAARPAIAAIPMPEPLKPLPARTAKKKGR